MTDSVHRPSHYTEGWSKGSEVIDITENLNFNRGNAVKYIARAGRKDAATELEDLHKAQWYLNREIGRLTPADTLRSWTLTDLESLRQMYWGQREPKWTIDIKPRQWNLLDTVPPNVIVEDRDGDHWRRIGGTGNFEIALKENIHGQHYEWQEVEPKLYLYQSDYTPFTEVST